MPDSTSTDRRHQHSNPEWILTNTMADCGQRHARKNTGKASST
jgi:hypothetical protein